MKEAGVGPTPLRAIGVSVQDEQDGPVDTEGRSVVVAVEDREADHVAVERGRLVEVCDPERGATDPRPGGESVVGRGGSVEIHVIRYHLRRVQRVGRGSPRRARSLPARLPAATRPEPS